MMMKLKTLLTIGALLLTGLAEAKTLRVADLPGPLWSTETQKALNGITIEFRRGDQLPVNVVAEGDLLETTRPAASLIGVKRDFWLRFAGNDVRISLDGVDFKRLNEVISGDGSLGIDAGTAPDGGVASAINILFRAHLK